MKLQTKIPVFDIEVLNFSNFKLADGPIVHNSKDIADAVGQLVYNCHINPSFHDDSLLPKQVEDESSQELSEDDKILKDFEKWARS